MFFHYKEPFLKLLHGIINANKEPLFLRVYIFTILWEHIDFVAMVVMTMSLSVK